MRRLFNQYAGEVPQADFHWAFLTCRETIELAAVRPPTRVPSHWRASTGELHPRKDRMHFRSHTQPVWPKRSFRVPNSLRCSQMPGYLNEPDERCLSLTASSGAAVATKRDKQALLPISTEEKDRRIASILKRTGLQE